MDEAQRYGIKDFYFWKITISLAAASFFVFAALYVVQPLLPVFVEDFNISVSVASLALSLNIAGLIIGLIVFGFLSDRMGRTFLIKLSILGSVVPFLIMPLTASFELFLGLRFIQGLLLAGLPAAALAYIAEEIQPRSISTATGFYIASNALGGMVGRVMSGHIADHFSWESAFYILALLGAVILIIVLIMLPPSRFFKRSQVGLRTDIYGFFYHFKNPHMLLIFGMGVILQLTFTGMWTYLPFYLQGEPFHMGINTISTLFLAYGLGVIGSPLSGTLADHFGIKPVRMIAIFTLSAGVLMTLAPSIIVVIIGLCVGCFGFFTAHSLTAASINQTATHHKGSASSLYLVSYYIGVSAGSSLLAPVWENLHWGGLIIGIGILPVLYIGLVRLVSGKHQQTRV